MLIFTILMCIYIYIYIIQRLYRFYWVLSQLVPCLPAIHSCCRPTAWSHLTPSICGFNAKRGGNKSEYFGIYLAKLLVLSDYNARNMKNIAKTMKHTEKLPRNGRLPKYIQNLEPCHARVSKIFYLVRFRIFEPYQKLKNNIKQLKNIEKQ